jgi:hypothetical protein
MMIPTDVETLKLHAAKSSAAFLSDFFRELMSDFMVSGFQLNARSLNYNLKETAAIRHRNPSFGLQKAKKWLVSHNRANVTGNTARDNYTSTKGWCVCVCKVKCNQSTSPRPCSLSPPNPKYFLFHPSHQIFRRMHGALNVGKKDN